MFDESGNPRIAGLGLATIARDPDSFEDTSDYQTVADRWTAPENLRSGKVTGKACDLFSFGMVVAEVGTIDPAIC